MTGGPIAPAASGAGRGASLSSNGRAAISVRDPADAQSGDVPEVRPGAADSSFPSAPLFADLLYDVAATAAAAGMPAEAPSPAAETEPMPAEGAGVAIAAVGAGDVMFARAANPEGGGGADTMSIATDSARGGAAMNATAATLRPAGMEAGRPVVTQPEKSAQDAVRPPAPLPAALERPAMAGRTVPHGEGGAASTAVEPAFALALPSAQESARDTASLRLPNGAATQWREPLRQALGERLHVEIGRGGERAVIRLDPPMMGRVEIVIRHEGGSLQVQLTATHGEVLRQLQGIGETLRQDLAQRHPGDVSVAVFDAAHEGGGRSRRDRGDDAEREPGRALGDGAAGVFAFNTDEE